MFYFRKPKNLKQWVIIMVVPRLPSSTFLAGCLQDNNRKKQENLCIGDIADITTFQDPSSILSKMTSEKNIRE